MRVQGADRESSAAANRQLCGRSKSASALKSTLRQMQRLEAMGQLTSGVAHDFNNLLPSCSATSAFLNAIRPAASTARPHSASPYMRSAAERGAKLTDQLLSFSRPPAA